MVMTAIVQSDLTIDVPVSAQGTLNIEMSDMGGNDNHDDDGDGESRSTTAAVRSPTIHYITPKPKRNIDLWVASLILALAEAARGVVIPVLSDLVDSVCPTHLIVVINQLK
jgi:hypothetical protein